MKNIVYMFCKADDGNVSVAAVLLFGLMYGLDVSYAPELKS